MNNTLHMTNGNPNPVLVVCPQQGAVVLFSRNAAPAFTKFE